MPDIHATPDNELHALARASLGGKKTAFLKAACSDELKELLERHLAAIRRETGRNVSESEFVEKSVAIALLGFDHVMSVEQEQLKRLAGHWSSLGQKVPA
jgi:hypothetical protein